MSSFYGGTSGLKIPVPKRDFPEHQSHLSRLSYYATLENSIEINSSFYKLPQAKTVVRWGKEVGTDFRFTFKLWKEVTHQKNLVFNTEDAIRFKAAIELPFSQRGCILVQLPPSMQVSAMAQLKELFCVLGNDWRIAVEFRHRSWYQDEVFDMLSGVGAAMVIQDFPKTATPIVLTSDHFVYLRFHGPSGNYKGSYSDSFLYEYAMYINEWQQEGKTVYCYFNNTAGDALPNLNFLRRALTHLNSTAETS
jgi:uncharacterized protein YecE (DUF72 family)